tara:strand:+ start:3783 stop:4898 length:1116 start_codon:yes stop_codon:yes gene_type:complete
MARRQSRLNKRMIMQSRARRRFRGITTKTWNNFDEDDIIESDVAKAITSALWSDNVSTLTTFFTSSTQSPALSTSQSYQNEVYAVDPAANASASVQFNIAWGHYAGSGSITSSGASDQGNTPSKAVYTSFANQLLAAGDDKFTIDSVDNDYMYFITVARNRFKEKMNPNGWQLDLDVGAAQNCQLIDDSRYNSNSSTNGNRVYNIISGTLASGTSTAGEKLGLFYPDLGILAISQKQINAVSGFAIAPTIVNANYSVAPVEPFVDPIKAMFAAITASVDGAHFQGRAEEDISSTHYFVRVKNSEYNFSNNPTFATNVGQLQNSSMVGDPSVYITTVGLYNDENELVATAKLSKPLLKTFAREATIRVKLDY